MTRFLLVFTLLTLAVPTTTEPAAQSSGTITAPDPEGPQPIRTTTESVPNLLEPVDSGNGTTEANASDSNLAPDPNDPEPNLTTTESVPNLLETVGPSNDTREVNQPSLGTTDTKPALGSTVPSWVLPDNGEIEESKLADLTQCFNRTKTIKLSKIKCYVGSQCFEGEDGKHSKLTFVPLSRQGRQEASFQRRIESCDVGAVLVHSQRVGHYQFEYHTTKEYLHLPLVIRRKDADRHIIIKEDALFCGPSCRIENLFADPDKENGYFWIGTVVFSLPEKRADLKQCYTKKSSLCFVGKGCLEGNNVDVHEKMLSLSPEKKLSFDYERAAGVGCNVAAVLIHLKPSTYSLEYHTTDENRRLFFTMFPPGLPRVGRRIWIKEGSPDSLVCYPACEFTRTEGESDKNYWSGELYFRDMSVEEAEEYERKGKNPAAIHDEEENEKKESKPEESQIAMILGVFAAVLVVCVAGVVIVVKVIQREQEKKHKKRQAAIEAAVRNKNN